MQDEEKDKNILQKSWETLTNSNEYDRGFKEGYADGMSGKAKDYHYVSAKSFIHGDKSMDTYTQGYDEGYQLGMINKQGVNTNILNTNNKMSQEAKSYTQQLNLLRELKSSLSVLQTNLNNVAIEYQKSVEHLAGEGLFAENVKILSTYHLAETKKQISELNDHITANDINFINRTSRYIEELKKKVETIL